MPRKCTICNSPNQREIDSELIAGISARALARRLGESSSAIYRHAENHLPTRLRKALEIAEVSIAETLRQKLEGLRAIARELLQKAEGAGDTRTAIAALRELARIFEYDAKMEGAIKSTQVNVISLQAPDPQALQRMASIYLERHGGRLDMPQKGDAKKDDS